MGDEKTVDIIIRGKNLTPEVFAQAQKQLKELGVEVETTSRKTKAGAADVGVFGQSWKQLTAGFTAANLITDAVYGLISLGKEAFNSASQLVNLKDKTGLSFDFLQRLGHVARGSGSDVNEYSDALYKMGLNVQKGGKETQEAVAKMGMSLQTFKSLSLEDQFKSIVAHIGFTSDAEERNATVVDIAGKSIGKTIAGMVSGYAERAAAATTMADTEIEALNRYQQKYEDFVQRQTVLTQSSMGQAL